ncbi:MAG: tetratricopeptide repeat protein [Chloroflexi bacterium]|nr:tetratricopeptide repeat protein [Chloroflexota bacterium]
MRPAELRERRQALGLSQADLGRALGVPRNTLARWERGELEMRHPELVDFALDQLAGQLAGDGAPHVIDTAPSNLPDEQTSLIGRERELAELRDILHTSRLVTLSGPGGVGKTRLAVRCARAARPEYPDGVWFVDLAPLTDPRLVAQTIAAALAVHQDPLRSVAASLTAALTGKRCLLVLDNCEHVLKACADVVANLLRSCTSMCILATSREPLDLQVERVYRVQPLFTLEPNGAVEPEQFLHLPAVKLLLERATSRSAPVDAQAHARALAEIAWRLDGLPLALELAATRLTVVGPAQLASRLGNALSALSATNRDTPDRHHTLRTTLNWSHALSSGEEQRVFRRIGVFAGGWTLEACQAVAGDDGVEPLSTLDVLSRLIGKSLVVAEPGRGGTLRYRLLETVRQYARERLHESGEYVAVRARHTDWYLSWLERFAATGRRPLRSAGALAAIDADLQNVRLALDSAMADPAKVDRAVRLAGRMWWFWLDRGRAVEGHDYIRDVLGRERCAASPASWADALYGAGLLAWHLRDLDAAHSMLQQAVDIRRQLPDTAMLATCVNPLARVVADRGDHAAAQQLFAEALRVAESADCKQIVARAHHGLGTLAYARGEFARAIDYFERSLEIARAIGDDIGMTTELASLAVATYHLRDIERALRFSSEVLTLRRDLGARVYQPSSLSVVAGLAARKHQAEAAARLHGAAVQLRDVVDVEGAGGWGAPVNDLIRRDLANARLRIGPEAFGHAVAQGRLLTLEHAVATALEVIETILGNSQARSGDAGILTRRESQVAALVARGMTNRQIAAELVCAESTATKHVEHIRAKLRFTSRSQIAAFAASLA